MNVKAKVRNNTGLSKFIFGKLSTFLFAYLRSFLMAAKEKQNFHISKFIFIFFTPIYLPWSEYSHISDMSISEYTLLPFLDVSPSLIGQYKGRNKVWYFQIFLHLFSIIFFEIFLPKSLEL